MKKFDRIFHPTDFSHGSGSAFTHALRIALASRADFHLLHVERPGDHTDWAGFPHVRATLTRWGMLESNAGQKDVTKLGLRVGKFQSSGKDVVESIRTAVAEYHPNLIVLAAHQRHGIDRWLHEPVAEPLAGESPAPILFVPQGGRDFVDGATGETRLRSILIPISLKPHPQPAVDAALAIGRTLGCDQLHLIFLHIGADADRPEIALPLMSQWTSEFVRGDGNIADEILKAVADADRRPDLIVMATEDSHGLLDALRGSTTQRVLRDVPCPLLAVPAAKLVLRLIQSLSLGTQYLRLHIQPNQRLPFFRQELNKR